MANSSAPAPGRRISRWVIQVLLLAAALLAITTPALAATHAAHATHAASAPQTASMASAPHSSASTPPVKAVW